MSHIKTSCEELCKDKSCPKNKEQQSGKILLDFTEDFCEYLSDHYETNMKQI